MSRQTPATKLFRPGSWFDKTSAGAVRWRVLDQTVAETKARNASASAADIDAAIDEALGAVRAERFDPHGG